MRQFLLISYIHEDILTEDYHPTCSVLQRATTTPPPPTNPPHRPSTRLANKNKSASAQWNKSSHTPTSALYPLRILPDLKSARTGAPIIKRPTASDLEIFHKNLWNMVAIAEKKLDLNYTWMGDCDDDFLLDDVLRTEERIVRAMSNRRSKEDSRRSGIKLRFRVGKSFGRPRR